MYKRSFTRLICLIAILAPVVVPSAGMPVLKEIMQGLRTDTNELADGLLIDDFAQVADAANQIASHPEIPPEQVRLVGTELGAEMPVFKQFDTAVHELSLSIARAARNEDRALAISEFHRMLDGCFACHAAYRERVAAVLANTPSNTQDQ